MNATNVEESATTTKLWPMYESITAATTAILADHMFPVELTNASGNIIDVRTAYGMYSKNDLINTFFIFFLQKSIGITFTPSITAVIAKIAYMNF